MLKVLVVDDDPSCLESSRRILALEGFEVLTAVDGVEAFGILNKGLVDLVISDMRMPRMGGLDLLSSMQRHQMRVPLILVTAFGEVKDAVSAMKMGAVDFLTKPFKRTALLSAVETVCKVHEIGKSKDKPELSNSRGMSGALFFGKSLAMQSLEGWIEKTGQSSANVLITGESGSGKECVARAIHHVRFKNRTQAPFVAINCAAMPEHLLESELFGHERGAFTGADQSRKGLFEVAHEGTLLLDEIGDMPLGLQPKILRVLQEGEIRPVGSTSSRKVNVRVVAATHRDLRKMVSEGKFREDLLYRLEVISIKVPPLRDRLEDLQDLAQQWIEKKSRGRSLRLSSDAIAVLMQHSWPGNVRELQNVLERAMVVCDSDTIEAKDLPAHLVSDSFASVQTGRSSQETIQVPLGTSLKEVEDYLIETTLHATSGDRDKTAKILGIHPRTLYRKLQSQKSE